MAFHPEVIILLSGKRKCGKDYLSEKLLQRIGASGVSCKVVRLTTPIKEEFASRLNLDMNLLMSADGYKERYRQEMVIWGESIRNADPGHFCRKAVQAARGATVWLVGDCRRKTDIDFFLAEYERRAKLMVKVRIEASERVRAARGWVYTKGIDDMDTECNLDAGVQWDVMVQNGDCSDFEAQLERLVDMVLAAVRN